MKPSHHIASIISLLEEKPIEQALLQIDIFGEQHKNDPAPLFSLYMLCLMKLTLLPIYGEKRDEQRIKRVLAHFETRFPMNSGPIPWDDFFSSYVVFRMACHWSSMDVDYLAVFKRTTAWNMDWISAQGPYSPNEIRLLKELLAHVSGQREKSHLRALVCIEYVNLGMLNEARQMAEAISSDDYDYKDAAFISMAMALGRQNRLQEAISCALDITHLDARDKTISDLIILHKSPEDCDKALWSVNLISNDGYKLIALQHLMFAFYLHQNFKVSESLVEQCIEHIQRISEVEYRLQALSALFTQLTNLDKSDVALTLQVEMLKQIRLIKSGFLKAKGLITITKMLFENGHLGKARLLVEESITQTRTIKNLQSRCRALIQIAVAFPSLLGQESTAQIFEEAYQTCLRIQDVAIRSDVLVSLSIKMAENGLPSAGIIHQASINHAKGLFLAEEKAIFLWRSMAMAHAQQGHFQEAIACAQSISDVWVCGETLDLISQEGLKQGKIEKAIHCAQIITNNWQKSNTFLKMYRTLSNGENNIHLESLVNTSFECALNEVDSYWRRNAVRNIATELARKGQINETFNLLLNAVFVEIKPFNDHC
jgi:tetratricopeptide (TPR) repeat protein